MDDRIGSASDRRREVRRAVLRGWVEIDARRYDLADWSEHGFRTASPVFMARLGDGHRCRLVVENEDGEIVVTGSCRIVRTGQDHSAATWDIDAAPDDEAGSMLAYFRQYWASQSI